MQIIFGKETAEKMRSKYVVLELETFVKDDVLVEAYCLISADKANLAELPRLDEYVKNHEAFVEAYKDNDGVKCRELYETVKGRFHGEVDSFYDEILSRFTLD